MSAPSEQAVPLTDGVRPLVLVDANWQAKPLITLLETTPAVGKSIAFKHFEQPQALDAFLGSGDPALAGVVLVLQQVTDYWKQELWQPLRGMPEQAVLVRFPLFDGYCFWPLASTDPRNRNELPLYAEGRYRFSDRIVAGLADRADNEDHVYASYLADSLQAFGDLDRRLIAEIATIAGRDALCDIAFTLFFLAHYRETRLFHAPAAPAGPVYGWLGAQVAARLARWTGHDPASLAAAVERHAAGLQGVAQFQFPVHPGIASHYHLAWAPPDGRTRFGKNDWTHRAAIRQAIGWLPWTP